METEIRDCNFERDTGFGNLTKRDSGNVILKSRDPGNPHCNVTKASGGLCYLAILMTSWRMKFTMVSLLGLGFDFNERKTQQNPGNFKFY